MGRNIKRAVTTAAALALVLAMTACGNKEAGSTEGTGAAVEPAATEETVELEALEETDETEKESEADAHFLEYLKGNEADANGETFWAVGEPDMEYALYDMNHDGVNELLVRAYGSWIYDIMLYKDGKIQSANVENLGSSGVTFVNDMDLFVSGDTGHEGRAMYVVSEINAQGNAQIDVVFLSYWDDWAASGAPEFYGQANPPQDYLEHIDEFEAITEEDYNALVEEYSRENTLIEWNKLGD